MLSFTSALLQGTLHSKTKLSNCWQNLFIKRTSYKRPSATTNTINFTRIAKPPKDSELIDSPVEDDELFDEDTNEQGSTPVKTVKDIWICEKGYEKILLDDLQSLGKNFQTLQGFVETQMARWEFRSRKELYQSSVWTRQLLPECRTITGESINLLARNCFEAMLPKLEHWLRVRRDKLIWTVHPLSPEDSNLQGRIKLVHKEMMKLFAEKRKSFFKTYKENVQEPSTGLIFFQLFMNEKNSIYLSDSFASFNTQWGWRRPLPFPKGIPPVTVDKAPPSRAYKKIEEIFALFHNPERGDVMPENSLCVELGAAPGGWTMKLLQRKMQVITVDRARLSISIPRSENLHHIISDGASWRPKEPVDWVLSDMALPPEKSLNVLVAWIQAKKTRNFIWTLKFTGEEYGVIEEARKQLQQLKCEFVFRHLANHGNEVCVIGSTTKLNPRLNKTK